MTNYQDRINKLQRFKSNVSSGGTEDNIAGFSTEVNDWKGGSSKSGYDHLIQSTKKETATITKKKQQFLEDVSKRITYVEGLFQSEYNANVGRYHVKLDKDPKKNRTKLLQRLERSGIDSSVKAKIRQTIR